MNELIALFFFGRGRGLKCGGPEPRKSGSPKGGIPKGWRPKGGSPKFRAFCSLSRPMFALFSLIKRCFWRSGRGGSWLKKPRERKEQENLRRTKKNRKKNSKCFVRSGRIEFRGKSTGLKKKKNTWAGLTWSGLEPGWA